MMQCQRNPPCRITPRFTVDSLPHYELDYGQGPAVGKKAAAHQPTDRIWLDAQYIERLSAAERLALYLHEVGHLEGAMCEACADHRAGEWLCALGYRDDGFATSMFARELEHRDGNLAAANLHDGFEDCGACRRGRAMAFADEPVGSTKTVTGYEKGDPFQVTLRQIRPGVWVEDGPCAEAWDAMLSAAEQMGVDYTVNTSFRDMEYQISLWNERMTPAYSGSPHPWVRGAPNAVGLVKGVAAYPGWSNHQDGRSCDISFPGGDDDREWFATVAEGHNIFRDASSERWHFTYGATRKYPLRDDPGGNPDPGSSPGSGQSASPDEADPENLFESGKAQQVLGLLLLVLVFWGLNRWT